MKQSRQTELWTVMRMIEWGGGYFREKRIDSPRLTIELMLAHVLQCTRFQLYLNFEQPLRQEELDELRDMIKRRIAREPLQYILGKASFYTREFVVRPGVLIPRPETEILVEEALRRTRPLRALDVGTGSGCIALTLALERPETEVVAIDRSEDAIEVARLNNERLDAVGVTLKVVDFFDDDAMSALGTFDLVISNPPYIPHGEVKGLQEEIRNHEPHPAVTDGGDGLAFYRRFSELADSLLRPSGEIFLEIGYGQGEAIRSLFTRKGYRVDIYNDLDKIERVVRVRQPDAVETVL